MPFIRATFRAISAVVINPGKFDLITAAAATADKADGIAAYVKATGGNIQVSPAFNSPTRGPNCQAAIVVHEATHVVDGASGADAAHIPEWATVDPPISGKVTAGPDATFSKTGYDLQASKRPASAIPQLCAAAVTRFALARESRRAPGEDAEVGFKASPAHEAELRARARRSLVASQGARATSCSDRPPGLTYVMANGTLAVHLHDGLARRPGKVVHLGRRLGKPAGPQRHALLLVELVAHADVERARQHRDVFGRRMAVRRRIL